MLTLILILNSHRLRLDHKKMISYDEFYAAFRPPKVRMAAMDLLLFSVFQESILEKFGHFWFFCHLQMKLTPFHYSFSIFCLQKADEGPAWLQLEKPDLKYMSAAQVHAHLKEKAKQRLAIILIYLLFSSVSFMVFYMNSLCLLPVRQIWRHFILHHHPPPRAKSVDPHPTPHKFSFGVIVAIK